MSDLDKKICRLCLDITPACECDAINEIKKEILKVLLGNIDLYISDNAVVCNRCLERLQNFFDFKSHCVTTCMNLVNEKVCLERSPICRLCLSMIEINTLNYKTDSDLKDEDSLKDIIENYFPEVDFDTVRDLLLCNACQSRVKEYYEFMRNCEGVEQRIHNYCQVGSHGTADRINLEDMLKFGDNKVFGELTDIKRECLNAESIDVDVKNEGNTIKCEEVHIKDEELDNGTEKGESGQLENDDSAEKKCALKTKAKVKSEGRTHLCPKCPCNISRRPRIETGTSSDSDNKKCKCFLCPLLTTTRLPQADTPSHKGSTKAFGCCECSYESNCKGNLKKHSKIHEDPIVAKKFKCEECSYRCIQKSELRKHIARHMKFRQHRVGDQVIKNGRLGKNGSSKQKLMVESSNGIMHLCPKCPHFSNKRYSSKDCIHFDSDKETCKCSLCPLLTAPGISKLHLPSHKGPTKTFGCCECSYETVRKNNLKTHFITHQSKLEIQMYNCAKCKFETKHKRNLRNHMITHEDPNVVKKFKCEECPYSSIWKYDIKKHMVMHRNKTYEDPSVAKKFKCEECPYRFTRKYNLNQHMVVRHFNKTHEDPKKFKCEKCPHRFTRRYNLNQHMARHSNKTRADSYVTKRFKCEECPFRSRRRYNLKQHMATH